MSEKAGNNFSNRYCRQAYTYRANRVKYLIKQEKKKEKLSTPKMDKKEETKVPTHKLIITRNGDIVMGPTTFEVGIRNDKPFCDFLSEEDRKKCEEEYNRLKNKS